MKANKQYYLSFRSLFIRMGYNYEVLKLDSYFKVTLIHDKQGRLIKIT